MTKNKRYTPGPWIPAGPSFGDKFPRWYDSVVVENRPSDLENDLICEMSEDPDIRNANAHLIAAAPELVEALEECTGCLDMKEGTEPYDSAMKALAKAYGETIDRSES